MPEVTGAINAEFSSSGGETQLLRHQQSYPLKIAKTFRFEGRQLGVYVMDASPGMMAGDLYEQQWRFGKGTDVFITNQSYTKVHPARKSDNDPATPTRQRQTLHLASGAYVEYMPEPLMLYNQAYFLSETDIRMERDSTLIFSEIVCPGRTHRGEQFQYELYRSRLSVWYDDELIFTAKQLTEPGKHAPLGAGRWDGYTHLGSLYMFSTVADAALVEKLRDKLERKFPPGGSLYFGISLTYKYGLAVSVLGRRVYEIADLLETAWGIIRSASFQKPPLSVPK
ncbi:urease accessory protein UreD [Paenibacillus allorhizosphaerae]|uniref:Urease accessory protein UreD n=1 Tax=Paenibacillus allorhizosphaerae TaxID=2849866 RepID=A0ABM8VUX4_9BACL|nr:urease accessory protein UreD [Paenibacillus allorhizosphaerae]CAG7659115.1 Urease accessory protein UreH [Paenibacillus allorhizosphaerae]